MRLWFKARPAAEKQRCSFQASLPQRGQLCPRLQPGCQRTGSDGPAAVRGHGSRSPLRLCAAGKYFVTRSVQQVNTELRSQWGRRGWSWG